MLNPLAAVDLPSPSEQSQDLSEAVGGMLPITPDAIFTQEPAPATLACLPLGRTSLLPTQPLHLLSPPTPALILQVSAGPFPCLLQFCLPDHFLSEIFPSHPR